jgi:hypothetical protein
MQTTERAMPTAYFRSWTFDAGVVFLAVGVLWLIVGVLLVLAGLGALTFAARRVSRQR